MPEIPPHLAHLSPEQIIAKAKQLAAARDKLRAAAEAGEQARRARREAMVRVAHTEVLEQYRDDPVGFAIDVLGQRPWSRSREVLESIRDHRRTAVRSGHKVAKSWSLAVAALWWVKTRRKGRVVATATKGEQIRDIFWREVRSLYGLADANGHPLGGKLYETAFNGLKFEDGREIIGKTSKSEGGAPGVGGYSGPEMLFIIDEASGVPNDVYEAFKGNLAGGGKLLVAGNPLIVSGFFYEAFTTRADLWNGIQISSEDTPANTGREPLVPGLADRDYVEDCRRECGPNYAEDPVYQTRVMGAFPSQASNAVNGLALVDAAAERWANTQETGVLHLGLDVGWEGDDESVATPRRGLKVLEPTAWRGLDGPNLAARVIELIFGEAGAPLGGLVKRDVSGRPAEKPVVKVDMIGYGASCYDSLKRRDDLVVYGINVAESATSEPAEGQARHHKLRDQLWFAGRDFMKGGGTVPPRCLRLRSDLIAPTFHFTSQGAYEVEQKKDVKKRLKRSPDYGDSYNLAVYEPPPPPEIEAGRFNVRRR